MLDFFIVCRWRRSFTPFWFSRNSRQLSFTKKSRMLTLESHLDQSSTTTVSKSCTFLLDVDCYILKFFLALYCVARSISTHPFTLPDF